MFGRMAETGDKSDRIDRIKRIQERNAQ